MVVKTIYSDIPVEVIDGHQIDDLHENSSFSKKLNTYIKTIKKHKDSILRFVDFFKAHPELLKSQHFTMEYYTQKFKQLAKERTPSWKAKHIIIGKNGMVFR